MLNQCAICFREYLKPLHSSWDKYKTSLYCSARCRQTATGILHIKIKSEKELMEEKRKKREAVRQFREALKGTDAWGWYKQYKRDYWNNRTKEQVEKAKAQSKPFRAKYREAGFAAAKSREYRRRVRKEVIKAYGGKCVCCGESIFEFLAIDHVNGGGRKHVQSLTPSKSSSNMILYRYIQKQGYPKDFQILCHNCNSAKGYYGKCPHNNL